MGPASETTIHGYTENRDAVLKRLRRIEGQVRGVERVQQERTEELMAAVKRLLHRG